MFWDYRFLRLLKACKSSFNHKCHIIGQMVKSIRSIPTERSAIKPNYVSSLNSSTQLAVWVPAAMSIKRDDVQDRQTTHTKRHKTNGQMWSKKTEEWKKTANVISGKEDGLLLRFGCCCWPNLLRILALTMFDLRWWTKPFFCYIYLHAWPFLGTLKPCGLSFDALAHYEFPIYKVYVIPFHLNDCVQCCVVRNDESSS